MKDYREMKERYNSIEFLRVVFSFCVIVGHIYCEFYRKEGENLISMQNMSVDAFFIISGIFIAISIEKIKESNINAFGCYQIRRFKRLFPMYFFSAVLTGIYMLCSGERNFSKYWVTLFFLDGINNFPGFVTGAWYVSALFWVGFLVAFVLFKCRKNAVVVYFPVLIVIVFSFMYSNWKHLSLNSFPICFGFLSAGCIKAILALMVGVETYYASIYLDDFIQKKEETLIKVIFVVTEIVAALGVASCLAVGGIQISNYLIYFFLPPLLMVFLLRRECVFKFATAKIWGHLAKYTYSVYLINGLALKIIKSSCGLISHNIYVNYVILSLLCFIAGIMLFEIEKFFEKQCINCLQ